MGKVTLLLVELAFILCKVYFSAVRIPIALYEIMVGEKDYDNAMGILTALK